MPSSSVRIPLPVPSVDIRSLPLGPEEAFVWSRVDGSVGPAEISLSTGLPKDRVAEALGKLHQLGAVRYDGEPPRSGPQAAPTPPKPSSASTPTPGVADSDPGASSPEGRFSLTHKQRVSDMIIALEQQDHYALLGVPRDADKKTIKEAYFAIVADYHPDKYFGQDLGENKARLEKVFQRLTLAHDTLTRSKRREEYDLTLPPLSPPKPPQAVATVPPNTLRSNNAAVQDAEPRIPPPPVVPKPEAEEARRRSLARKLQNASSGPHAATHSSSGTSLAAAQRSASGRAEPVNLRGFRAPDPVHRYLAAARSAEEEGNVVGMANSLRLALSLDPENPSISQQLAAAEQRVDTEMADSLEAQARSHESQRDYPSAAKCYGRAARGKQSGQLYLKAAECAKLVPGQLRQAGEYAKSAVGLAPDNAQLRLFLGQIYVEAGMLASALTELDRAQQLSPEDETIKAWLKRVKRGDV